MTGALLLLPGSRVSACVGLCCARCDGNMPGKILGGGMLRTYEFRFTISPALLHMEALRDGTSDLDATSIPDVPAMGGC